MRAAALAAEPTLLALAEALLIQITPSTSVVQGAPPCRDSAS